MNTVPGRGQSGKFLPARVCMHESLEIQYVLQSRDFQKLLDSLIKRGYQVLGPTVRDGAIVYGWSKGGIVSGFAPPYRS